MEEGTDNGEMPSGIIRAGEGSTSPSVSITYFVADATKDGGSYVTVEGSITKIDLYQRILTLADGKIIKVDDAIKLEGELFDEYGSSYE